MATVAGSPGSRRNERPFHSRFLYTVIAMPRFLQSPAKIISYLGGAEYPAYKDELVAIAMRNNAPSTVVKGLQSLPDREYRDAADVVDGVAEGEGA